MTNDQQQVEAWTEQFENWAYDYPGSPLDKKYLMQAWIAAKRNQPVIELPDPDHYYLDDDVYDADQVHAAITAAGYSYRVAK